MLYSSIDALILVESQKEVPVQAIEAAQKIAQKFSGSVMGVLFYGSCLRTGTIQDRVLDFYIIVDDYNRAYNNVLPAIGNSLVPPNVFYFEENCEGVTIRAKYAVLSLASLKHRCSSFCLNISIWARFCQPCRLLLEKDKATRDQILKAVTMACLTMIRETYFFSKSEDSIDLWSNAFELTYRAELRSEKPGKGLELYKLDEARYNALTLLIMKDPSIKKRSNSHWMNRVFGPKLTWSLRRIDGKLISFLRLLKASLTFRGGIDYLAWKISRHSGVAIDIKPWMRRFPIIAGLYLFPKLRGKGAFR